MVRKETVIIPYGFYVDSQWVTEVQVREITGYDEILISEIDSAPIPIRTTLLLKLLVNLGLQNGPHKIQVDDLTLGDRNTLILHIRKLIYGDIVECLFKCTKCAERLTFELDLNLLLQPSNPNRQRYCTYSFENLELKIRPVTFSDMHDIVQLKDNKNKLEYATTLIKKCIMDSNHSVPQNLSKDMIYQISSKLEELDPQANIILKNKCPMCHKTFEINFLPEEFLFKEIDNNLKQFDTEVHLLALNYHWNLDQICSLPSRQRKKYADLIIKS